jgi:signal transduction protein with GAF and PtsI domain
VEVDGVGLVAIIAFQDLRKLASDALSQGVQLQKSVYMLFTSSPVLSKDQLLARLGVQRRQHRVFTTMLKPEFVEGAFSLTC